jgi:hypothetical protein
VRVVDCETYAQRELRRGNTGRAKSLGGASANRFRGPACLCGRTSGSHNGVSAGAVHVKAADAVPQFQLCEFPVIRSGRGN